MQEAANFVTVDVAYYDPFNVYGHVSKWFDYKLANLHWRPSEAFPLRPLPQIQLLWREQIPRNSHSSSALRLSGSDVPSHQFLHDFLQQIHEPNAYVKAMLVLCNDIDDYRARVRPLIREWLKQEVDSQIVKPSWFVVYYDSNDSRSTLERNPFSKMKSDFAGYESAQFLRLKAKDSHDFSALLQQTLRSGFLDSISRRYAMLARMLERVKIESFSGNPRFPISLKAAMATVLEDVGLYEDSLLCYEELRAMFDRFGKTGWHLENGFVESNALSVTFLHNEELFKFPLDKKLIDQSITKFGFYSFVFVKESQILLSLSQSESSLSLGSIHLVELMKRAKHFLLDMEHLTSTRLGKVKLSELGFMLIDEILALSKTKQLVSDTLARINSGDVVPNDRTVELIEFLAELKLQQRTELVTIGEYLGYRIKGRMMDVAIEEDASQDYHFVYEPLADGLKSQSSFEKLFASLTEVIIHDYALAGNRPRSVDILSTELAIIAYGDRDYEKAIQIMEDSFIYYQQHGWKFVSGYLLKIYVECLQKVQSQPDRLLRAYIELLSANICTPSETSEIIGNILRLSQSLEKPSELFIDRLFGLSIKGFIFSGEPDRYNIPIVLKSQFVSAENNLVLDNVKLVLASEDSEIVFEEKNKTIVKHGETVIKLLTNTLRTTTFKLKRLTANIGKVVLTKEFDEDTLGDYPIKMYQFAGPENMKIALGMPRHRELNNDKLLVSLTNGAQPVSEIRLRIRGSGATLFELENSAEGSVNGEAVAVDVAAKEEEQTVYSVSRPLAAHEELQVLIPCFFSITKDGQAFTVEANVEFKSNNELFQSVVTQSVKPSLTIAVSVQDIFKSQTLFSNFAVGTADINRPFRVNEVTFRSNKPEKSAFSITTGVTPRSVIAFGEQPANYFFKVLKDSSRPSIPDESLLLTVNYSDIIDECWVVAKRLFQDSLTGELDRLKKYEFLMDPILEKIVFRVNLYSLSNKLQSQSVDFGEYNADILNHVPPADYDALLRVLTSVTEKLSRGVDCQWSRDIFSGIERQLVIAVPLRAVDVIESVEIKFERKPQYVVGEQINATLYLQSITSWANPIQKKSKKRVNFQNPQTTTHRLYFDIGLLENWLISGTKSGEIEVAKNKGDIQVHEPIEIILFPLKVGRIPLPKIEISPVSGEISIEIDYKNDSETIFVVSEMDKVTLTF